MHDAAFHKDIVVQWRQGTVLLDIHWDPTQLFIKNYNRIYSRVIDDS